MLHLMYGLCCLDHVYPYLPLEEAGAAGAALAWEDENHAGHDCILLLMKQPWRVRSDILRLKEWLLHGMR